MVGILNINNLGPMLRACRPRQWTKNLLVFAAPLFSFRLDLSVWLSAIVALVCFCLISSSVYLFNDCLDVAADRAHPTKRNRPIACRQISQASALATALLLVLVSLSWAAWLSPALAVLLILYGIIQVGYCLQFKRMPLLDLFCIASGFLLRAMAGAVAGKLPLSPWFLLTVGMLPLFLAIEKRKAELRVVESRGFVTRKVLERYSLPLLLRLESLVSTSAFISYALWSADPALRDAQTSWMLLTVPLVLVGIFRYQLLSDPDESERRRIETPDQSSEKPEEILLGYRGIRLTFIAWLFIVAIVGIGHRTGALPEIGLQP